ncbi:MAG: hypothetical protein LBH43_09415 [Treponema sp.]|jgi:hypothetical protein|nr:hypothetical protein [Treponema sp.]
MLVSYETASQLIEAGRLLHFAGSETLLKKLPKGKWIGGSTEYFMAKEGGKVTADLLSVTDFSKTKDVYEKFKIQSYDEKNICEVSADAYENGFSILIIPFDSVIHKEYAHNASEYKNMFLRHIAGWISGINLGKEGQTPVAVNGFTGEVFSDKAVALHLQTKEDKTISVNIINIFEQDTASPVIEFTEEGFHVKECLVNGKGVVFADYITKNKIDTKLPIVGDYSGSGVNISFKSIEDGIVNFYAPVFQGIKYRIAKPVSDYADLFNKRILEQADDTSAFTCNCILNFLYGNLENNKIEAFAGPITFGEIAYQLVNQTLVYVTVI